MKEQELANKDEIVMGELFPITISDKRIYIVNKKRKKSRSIILNKIIQLDKISAIRTSNEKRLSFRNLGILFLILTLAAMGLFAFLYFQNKALLDQIVLYLIVGIAASFLFSFLFFLLFGLKRTKTIWIEYPTNINNLPTKVIFKKAKTVEFNNLVNTIFNAIDNLSKTTEFPHTSKNSFKI